MATRTPPPLSNPFGRARSYRWLIGAVWFALGFICGQFVMGWALKPDSYTFPTYQLQMPRLEPDT